MGGAARQLFLLRTLEGFDELRTHLAGLRPIEVKPAPKNSWLTTAGSLGTVAAMVTVYRSASAPLVATLGLLLIAMLIWCFVAVQRGTHVDRRLKLTIWVVRLVVPSLAFKVYQSLVN